MSQETAVAVKDATVVPPEEVAKRVICLRLGFRAFGVRRKVDPRKIVAQPQEALENDAADSLHVGKDIIESETLNDVRRLATEARLFSVAQSVPASFLRGGMYLIPYLALDRVNQRLTDLRDKHAQLVDVFLEEYEDEGSGGIRARAEKRLAPLGLYDPKDYPASAQVRAAFRMRWQWFEFSVPQKLRETNPALWEQENKKFAQMWAEASAEIRAGLRAGVQDIVAKLMVRLEPGDDGKRKALRENTLAPLMEFLDSFPFKNVTSDEALRVEIERLRALTKGVDVDDLKKYGGLRTKLRNDLGAVASKLATLVEEAPERRISFEDE